MSKIFDCSKIAQGQSFVGRKDELKKLSSHFVFQTNTVLLAPRGWGKTSLIFKAAEEAMHKENTLRFCHVDLSNVRNEERFYELLARSVMRAVSSTQEEVLDNVRRYFPHTQPRISFRTDSLDSLEVDFDWEDARRNADEILDLPFSVAKDRGLKVVVCVDEFHSISLFSDPEALLDRMKARWPRHQGVAYCISASPVSLVEKFVKSAPMFYRYGETMSLGPVRRTDMVKLIRDKFADTAKYIDNENAAFLLDLSGETPVYVYLLAQLSWMGTSVVCSREVIAEAHSILADQMGPVFENLTASLTSQQLCYIHAVLAGETVMSTSEVLHRHHITSATSASRSKASLLERGIIYQMDGRIHMADPIYAFWLKNRYFD